MRPYSPRPCHSPALVAECLTIAAASRIMWRAMAAAGMRPDYSSAREWIAKARVWRLHAERELAANAAFIAAHPHLVRR